MDILLTDSGDMYIDETGDILLGESVAQKIRIRILWFEGEWRWDNTIGLPYFDSVFIKKPDLNLIERLIRERIYDVDEVVAVKNINVLVDNYKRTCVVKYTAETDEETIKEEVELRWQITE